MSKNRFTSIFKKHFLVKRVHNHQEIVISHAQYS